MSPKYTTSARGSLFLISNKTESPPDPESNIPNIAKVYPRYANLVLMPEYSGHVTANLVSLRFPESGRLAWLKCRPGLIVTKDAPLAALDPRPIQSKLDVSVKAVEKSKLQLDSLTLYSPAAAVIVSTEGLIPGINITPSGFPIILAPLGSTGKVSI